jgi:hypothetical protein
LACSVAVAQKTSASVAAKNNRRRKAQESGCRNESRTEVEPE